MAGPLAGGGPAAVTPGEQAGALAASAVPRPSSGAAETAAATSPVDAIRFRRVRSWRFAGAPCSDVDEVIGIAFLGGMTAVSSGRDQGREEPGPPLHSRRTGMCCESKHTYTRKQVNHVRTSPGTACDIQPTCE